MARLKSSRIESFFGGTVVPGDKSISHRALLLSSQFLGTHKIYGLLKGEDVLCTMKALQEMGVLIREKEDYYEVQGIGIGALKAPSGPLYMGNSGTSVRLMAGLVAPYDFEVIFEGDESLSKRPMGRIITPLSQMGVQIRAKKQGIFTTYHKW